MAIIEPKIEQRLNSKNYIDVYIAEYLWRRHCESRNADPFKEFLEYIRKVYYIILF